MLSEGIHSFVDSTNEVLLILGIRRAARPADETHPFGHGMEVYFWAFVVALLIFTMGGAMSIYQGFHRLRHPDPIQDVWVNFVVLGISILIEATTLVFARRELRRQFPDLPLLAAVRASKDPGTFAIALEDAAAVVGLVIAMVGVALAVVLDQPLYDGLASIGIGLVLIATAVFLARETLSLLTGESASAVVNKDLRRLFAADERILGATQLFTMQLGVNSVLVAANVEFRDRMTSPEIEKAVLDLTNGIRACHPSVTHVFLRPADAAGARAGSTTA